MNPTKIAITGIDGCGKSTVINELIQWQQQHPDKYQVFACTNFHATPNAPFAQLSQGMDLLSQYADQVNDPTIKYVSLYLKMTLYGAIEDFYCTYFQPKNLIMERHPLVGSLAYGSLYLQMNASIDLQKKTAWNPQLKEQKQIPWKLIMHWFELENKRLNRTLDFWNLPSYLLEIQQQKNEMLIPSLIQLFRTTLPSKIIHFQIDEQTASERVGLSKTKEIHESKKNLKYISLAYKQALKHIETLGVTIVYIPVKDKTPQELKDFVINQL